MVLTADRNAVTTLKNSARRQRAIAKVEEQIRVRHGDGSPQKAELDSLKSREAAAFTSALRETFKSIIFPQRDRSKGSILRSIDDFRMEFERNDYSGELQIIETLVKRGKFVPSDRFEQEFETLRLDAEEILFDAEAVQKSSLERNAAVRPAWFWLPRAGLDSLIRESIRRGFWREKEGLIAKKWLRVTKVTARLDDFAPDPMVSGRFQVNVTPEDADTVFVSEAGPPDPKTAAKLDGRIYETAAPAAWFLAVDSTGSASTGDVCEWRAPLRVKLDAKRNAAAWRLTLQGVPRAANIRVSFDGTDPRIASPVSSGEIDAPSGATQVRALVELDGKFSFEETARLAPDGFEFDPNAKKTPVQPDSPATMTSRFQSRDTAQAFTALDRLSKMAGAKVKGGSVEVKGKRTEDDYLTLRFGRDVTIDASELDRSAKELATLLAAEQPLVTLQLSSVAFPSGRDLMTFCDDMALDFDRVEWKQD